MLRKNLKGFAIGFAFLLLVVLCIAVIQDEVGLYHGRKIDIKKEINKIDYPSGIYGFLFSVADVRKNSPIPSKEIIGQVMSSVNFETHSVYQYLDSGNYSDILDNWQRLDLTNHRNRRVTTAEAAEYYKEHLGSSAKFIFSFPWLYYLAKFLFVVGLSIVPVLLSVLASFLSLKFSLSFVTAVLLLLVLTTKVRAQDNMIEFGTSTTGGKHSLSLFILHMDKKTTGGGILFQEGAWAWWGPLFNVSNGVILAPVGFTFGKGENGLRAEHLSVLTVGMFKFGKITPMVMGFFNKAIVKGKSSFAWAKTVMYYDFPGFMAGVRADFDFWVENQKWKNTFNVGPIAKFRKKLGEKAAFIFQVSGTFTKPYTLRTQWELDF